MKLGALGDVHGDFASVRAVMARHPEIPAWVSVGDLADDAGAYEPLPVPLYWIKGNNDNLEYISRLSLGTPGIQMRTCSMPLLARQSRPAQERQP